MEKERNITWHNTNVTKQHRQLLHGHKSPILWFTGLSGSGKSTIANLLEQNLHKYRKSTYLLDGDNIRHGLNSDLSFNSEDRKENIRRIGEVAKLFVDSGIITLVSFISPYKADRKIVRNLVQDKEFIEIYIKCPLDICEQRDPKGLYKRARKGEIKNFTGISSPYEKPEDPEIILETEKETKETAVDKIIKYLKEHQYI
ncbi:adenylyl-sulfate kinase [Scopulibacillus darangshiensis]|uniref:adenylyl-sulfate kinase n=1 Tax=Scopulibacillus darangshiensis TaxID=442528 RepID=UPI001044EB39|nr:adenylyl-sulfate kinase [Scopulibacillus darangshiensis]